MCSVYVVLVRFLDNEFSISIENLKLENVILLKIVGVIDFLNLVLNLVGESRSDEDVGVNEDIEYVRKCCKMSRKVLEFVVLLINVDDIGGY